MNRKIIKTFSLVIGYAEIMAQISTFNSEKTKLNTISKTIKKWIKDYSNNGTLTNIGYEESVKIHNLIDEIREEKLFIKDDNIDSFISDDLLVWYEFLMKQINKEIIKNEEKAKGFDDKWEKNI